MLAKTYVVSLEMLTETYVVTLDTLAKKHVGRYHGYPVYDFKQNRGTWKDGVKACNSYIKDA